MKSDHTAIDRTGTVIDGKYAVERVLAYGGYSTVYRAERLADGVSVALKVLELLAEPQAMAIERFVREHEFVQQLTSPNTIRIFDTQQVGTEFLYSVMEYIPGRSLAYQIKRHGALNPRQVAEIASQLCNSLIEVHEHGMLHRDLKPSNIMLFRNDEGRVIVKLLDFGIAKMLAPGESDTVMTQAGTFVGTPRYASPEQMRREALTPASDVYSLGLIMWEALTGGPTIASIDYSVCVEAHLNATPWILPDNPAYPLAFRRIIERALAKPVEARYQSCTDLQHALHRFIIDYANGAAR